MAKKILLNIFYNIAILTLVLCLVWLFNHQKYGIMVGLAFILALFIYFKIRLIKSVRELAKSKIKNRK